MIRGLGRETRHWGKFRRLMEKECGLLHCLELPGFGTKVDQQSPTKIDGYVENLRREFFKVIGKNGEGRESILLSISLGGMVGLEWMARYPNDFEAGFVINTSDGSLSGPWDRISFEGIGNLVKSISLKTTRERERNIFRLVSNRYIDDQTVDEWDSYAQEFEPQMKNFLNQMMAAMKFRVPKIIQTPLLFLASKRDRMVNVKCSENLAKHFQANISYHLDAGHDLPLDDPPWVVRQLKNFSL
ncbi:alpha/beta hydrolase [Bacteriovoracales bacterium]|nr:alpha/beta hydrolase [Bacteriovoracales bacterium]